MTDQNTEDYLRLSVLRVPKNARLATMQFGVWNNSSREFIFYDDDMEKAYSFKNTLEAEEQRRLNEAYFERLFCERVQQYLTGRRSEQEAINMALRSMNIKHIPKGCRMA